jgi:hypothetical protein
MGCPARFVASICSGRDEQCRCSAPQAATMMTDVPEANRAHGQQAGALSANWSWRTRWPPAPASNQGESVFELPGSCSAPGSPGSPREAS